MCGAAEETEQHLFFECEFSHVFWYYYSLQLDMKSIMGQDFCESWQGLCARLRDEDRQEKLSQECVFIMRRIWKSRNEMVFKGVLTNPKEGLIW
ncbi:hypothetical protein ACFX11_022799 [Malus domestica]